MVRLALDGWSKIRQVCPGASKNVANTFGALYLIAPWQQNK